VTPDPWEWLTQNGPALGATAATASALAAIVTAVVAVRSLRGTRRDSAERTRPFVTGELRLVQTPGFPHVALVVANRGPTPARDVEVTFDPPLPAAVTPATTRVMVQRYARPVPTLAPGQELSNIWHVVTRDDEPYGTEPTDNPRHVTVTVSYRGSSRGAKWSDEYPLDLDVLLAETTVTQSTDVGRHLTEIARQLKVISARLHQLEKTVRGEPTPERLRGLAGLVAHLPPPGSEPTVRVGGRPHRRWRDEETPPR
jgi:hypothetical protein